MLRILSVSLKAEPDIVFARQRARQLAGLLGFDRQDQTRIATAVSEIARNAVEYGGGGCVKFSLTGSTSPQLFQATISDEGAGIANLEDVLAGRHRSTTGMGVGLIGARRLVDQFSIESTRSGTTVALKKLLPVTAKVFSPSDLADIADRLLREDSNDPMLELRRQNQELIFSLEEVERQRKELASLNEELHDTNRGVVALYSDLDEKAEHLRRADSLKSRFLSNMTHEFRTPLNSILALTHLLLDRCDGELMPEQERQISFIRKSAESLTELVNDLLDLAKVEAGRIEIRPVEFRIGDLFGALRGMLRPLLVGDKVNLVFEDASSLPAMFSDEAKISQVLRNLISNALKFTEAGEIHIKASMSDGCFTFTVKDDGIGIAPEHHELIFQEFSQLDSPIQRRVRGTGLGLPLSKRLCKLLGGDIHVDSAVGKGSTFSFTLPAAYAGPVPDIAETLIEPPPEDERIPVLAIEDDPADMMVYEATLRHSPYRLIGARNLKEARRRVREVKPRAIILDLLLEGADTWALLADLKSAPESQGIPVIVVSTIEDRAKAARLGADGYGVKPIERAWLLAKLHELIDKTEAKRVLLIDDDEASRYIIRRCLADEPYVLSEAATGEAGLASAAEHLPDLVLLDLKLPGISGFDVLDQLIDNPRTAQVPIVVVTATALNEHDLERLGGAKQVVAKSGLSKEALAPVVAEALGGGVQP